MKLSEGEKQIIELIREVQEDEMKVLKETPYVAINKRGLYVSPSLQSDEGKTLSWKQFEEWECDAITEDFENSIKLLEKSIARMKKAFYAKSTLA